MTTQLPERPPTSLSDTASSLRVLLAANSKVYQMLLTRLLEAAGHRVMIVPNGKEAVAAFCSQPFDLILTEVQMPDMTGPEAAARIRLLEQGTMGHVPIVAVTADPGDCPRTDIDYCLPKPVCPDSLRKAIAAVIGTRSAGNTFSASPSADCGPLVKAQLVEFWGGDADLAREIATAAREEFPRLLTDIRVALDGHDALAVTSPAKLLNSDLRYVSEKLPGIKEAIAAADALEKAVQGGNLASARSLLPVLETVITGCVKVLEQIDWSPEGDVRPASSAAPSERLQRFLHAVDDFECAGALYTLLLRALHGHYDAPGGLAKAEKDADKMGVGGHYEGHFVSTVNTEVREAKDRRLPTLGHALIYAARYFSERIDRSQLDETLSCHRAGIFEQIPTVHGGLFPDDEIVRRQIDKILNAAPHVEKTHVRLTRRRGKYFIEVHYYWPGNSKTRSVARLPTTPKSYDSVMLRLKRYTGISHQEPLHAEKLRGRCDWKIKDKPVIFLAHIFGHADRLKERNQHETVWVYFKFPEGRPDVGPWEDT
jgi:CheY-like chemotaxis protein